MTVPEKRRVLRPGGCLVAVVWQNLDSNPAYAALVETDRTNREPEEVSGQS